MKLSKVFVFMEETRGRVFVGELAKTDEGYSFVYNHDYMSRASATAIGPELSFSLSEIKSEKMFDSLAELIPSRDNPAYEQYCRSVGISPNENDPLVLLAYLGKGPSNFVFEPAPEDTLPSGKDVRQFRDELGLSQRQFALFFDIPFPTLQTIEKETSEAKTARRFIQIFIDDPSVLWKVIKRRGLYLHTKQRIGIEDYIRRKEQTVESEVWERQKTYRQLGYIEVYHNLLHPNEEWNDMELLKAAEQAVCRNTGWPIGVVLHTESGKPVFLKDGIEAELEPAAGRYDKWFFKKDGSYHFFRTFREDENTFPGKSDFLNFDTRVWNIAETLAHCENLYKALSIHEEEKIAIRIIHSGLNGRKLTAANQMRAFSMSERKNSEFSIQWDKVIPLTDLQKNRLDYIVEISRELFMLFDGWQPDPGVIEKVYEEFQKSRI